MSVTTFFNNSNGYFKAAELNLTKGQMGVLRKTLRKSCVIEIQS